MKKRTFNTPGVSYPVVVTHLVHNDIFRGHLFVKTILGFMFIFSAIATHANQEDLFDMNLEQLMQVNITGATLREESIKTVPSSTTVFTRQQLDVLGLDYLHELLALVPGMQVNRSADSPINYSYSIRGRRQGIRSREILLLVDGRTFTDPRSGGADSALVLYPLANIERVEIIRGPASAIYGSGAFTGVINIISRKQARALRVGVGENHKRTADINLSHESGNWQTNLYTRLSADDGQAYNINGTDTRDPREETVIDWNLNYGNSKMQVFFSRADAEDFYVLEKINNDFNFYRQEARLLRFEQDFQPADNWKINTSVGYRDTRQYFRAMLFEASDLNGLSQPASNDPMLVKVRLFGEAYQFNLANDLEINTQLSTQFGIEWQREAETEAQAYNNYDMGQLIRKQFPINYYGNFEHATASGARDSRNISGIYSQWLYNFTSNTRLTTGVRYDHYEMIGSRASPRIGIVHQLNAHHTVKALYGEAFRAPSFSETGLLNNPLIVGNPNLDSEVVKTSELLWLGSWNSITLGATVYHNKYKNPIGAGFNNGIRTYVNGVDQENYGGGFRFDWQINDRWMLRTHYSSMYNLPDSYFREADKLSSVGFNYQQGKWNWNVSAIYNSEREYALSANQRVPLASYWYANSQLRYQFNRTQSLSLAAKNLFDKTYATAPQGAGIVGAVPNRGREASLVWQWEW